MAVEKKTDLITQETINLEPQYNQCTIDLSDKDIEF